MNQLCPTTLAAIVLLSTFTAGCRSSRDAARTVSVTPERAEGYPSDPSRIDGPLRQDLRTLRLARRKDATYEIALGTSVDDASLATRIDLRPMIPRVPDLARSHPDLVRLALIQREFNRNQTDFGIVGDAGTLKLADNCLSSQRWEIMLERDGAKSFHGWFDFPLDEYGRLFEEINGLPFDAYRDVLTQTPEFGGFKVPIEYLRSVTATRTATITAVLDEPLVRLSQQRKKRGLLATQDLETFREVTDPARQPIVMARFRPPGVYDLSEPERFDVSWLAHPRQATRREVEAVATDERLTEYEIQFDNGHRLIIADEALATLPARVAPPETEADVLKITSGISTPRIYANATEREHEFTAPRANYLMILDGEGRHLNNHGLGIDRVFFWRDAGQPSQLHAYILSYERIVILAHYVFADTVA